MANDSTVRNVFYEKRSTDEGPESYIVAIDYEVGLVVYVHPASYDGDIFKDPGAAYTRTADGLNAAVETPIAIVDTVLARAGSCHRTITQRCGIRGCGSVQRLSCPADCGVRA
jgi:hypothetical protein